MHNKSITASELSPNYRLEIPTHLQWLLAAGVVSGMVGLALFVFAPAMMLRLLASVFLLIGILAALLIVILSLVTSNRKRLTARRKMLESVAWHGDEIILDVGCGNGFLLLEAAKHLTTGKATGIDLWQEEAGGQNAETVWRNARLEGVTSKIDLQNVDARKMPFESHSFDVIVSSLALHHMGNDADRERAVQEMIRVLKPGGKILLYDMFPMINQAATIIRQHQFNRIQRLSGFAMRLLSATK